MNFFHKIYIAIGSLVIVTITLYGLIPKEYIIPAILIVINLIFLSILYDYNKECKLQPQHAPKNLRNPIDKYLTYADVEFAIYNLKKQIVKENFLEYEYLFSWENVPGIDSQRLINFFQKIQFLEWVQNPTIEKSVDGKEIKIFEGNNSCSLKLNEEKTNAILKIADSKNYEFLVKKENNNLKIYRYDSKKNIIIGIDRGGAIVGGMLAKTLGLAITTLAVSYANPPKSNLKNIDFSSIKKILLVDDAIRKGKTMQAAWDMVERERSYLFSWDEIQRNDYTKLIEFLTQNYEVNWARTSKI